MNMISNQRSKFSLTPKSIYLNCAYMSPLLKAVEAVGIKGMARKRNPALVRPEDFFAESEKVRKQFARLINAEPQRIVLVPSVSYGMANVVKNVRVQSGDQIVVASGQFPSNYYPWHQLCRESGAQLQVVPPPDTLNERGKQWNDRLLHAINKRTRLIALGNVHWADGTKFNLKEIRQRSREVGALLIVDGTQSVGAMPFDVGEIQPDALVCAGYKWLMGPYSMGLAYYGPYFDNGKPVEENWINRLHSEDFAGLVNYESEYQPGALRYEEGEHSNFILVPMLLEALKQINRWKPAAIQQYCAAITRKPIELLRNNGFWMEDEGYRGHHLFGIRLPRGLSIEKVKKSLQKHSISISLRGDAIRVSPHLYNDEKQMMTLVRALTIQK
jgi:selenocysteine lyase/cysteine desulfurase